jgi:alcohol dehydrogenase YqhD (iron-dependent ADH family)
MAISIFDFPTRMIFGIGSLAELGKEAKTLGQKALIVTYPDLKETGLLDIVLKDLSANGIETEIFMDVEPNPRSKWIGRRNCPQNRSESNYRSRRWERHGCGQRDSSGQQQH